MLKNENLKKKNCFFKFYKNFFFRIFNFETNLFFCLNFVNHELSLDDDILVLSFAILFYNLEFKVWEGVFVKKENILLLINYIYV